jgi:hypothetical protein
VTDEVEGIGEVSGFPLPGRAMANDWFESLQKKLTDESCIIFCIADFDESFINLKEANTQFLEIKILDWIGWMPHKSFEAWVYYGERLHPMFARIGAVAKKQSIDPSNIPFFQRLSNTIMEKVIESRTSFMEEVIETVPVLYPFIYSRELPEKDKCESICTQEFQDELNFDDGNPLRMLLGVIAHEANAQLWKLDPREPKN